VAEDRNLLERAQDYLVSGDFDRDARYVLGPHLSKSLSGLAELMGPGADIKAMVDESKRIVPSLKEGNIPGAVTSLGLAAVAPLLIGAPTDVGKIRKGTEEVKRYIDEPVDYKFTTGRGSTYEAFPSGKTQRDKAPGHRDGGVGLQRESEKTIFTDGSEQGRRTASDIVGISKSENPTQILPILSKSDEVVGIKLVHASDIGPKKVGDTILQMPVSTKPDVGKQPIEIFGQGTDVHVGSPITKIEKTTEELIPQRLFHGTPNPDIKKFKYSKEGTLGEGVYLTPDPKYASTYATGDTANVIPVTANIKNPLVVQSTGAEPSTDALKALGVPEDKAFSITEKAFDDKGNITKEISTRARKQGYDAVILKNKDGDIKEIVSYKPDNISSAITNKNKGGSVIERNPYNYSPRSI